MEMLRRGWEVHAAVPDSETLSELRRYGIETHSLQVDRGGTNPFREYETLRCFKSLIQKIRPQLSHHFSTKAVIYGCMSGVGVNIATITGIGYSLSGAGSTLRHLPVQMAARTMYKSAMRRCDRVIFQNGHDRDLFVERGLAQPQRTQVIPGSGVDMDYFHPSKRIHRIRPVRFVLLARMLISKGIADFAEAAKLAKKLAKVPCEFVLMGHLDPENPSCVKESQIRQWESEGIVTWMGPVHDAVEAYADADVAVLPSYYNEGLSRSLVEAAAMALPIITTDNPGCRDVVERDLTGIVVPMRATYELARAMAALADDPDLRESLGRRGRLFVAERFSQEDVLRQILNTYDHVLGQGGIPSFG